MKRDWARLHIRGGKRRLRQGKIAAGIVTLYDALTAAMEAYAASPERRAGLDVRPGEDVRDEKALNRILARSGVVDGSFDFEAFDRLMEKALREELPAYDYQSLLHGYERVMIRLQVLPLDESSLPPEDPKTY